MHERAIINDREMRVVGMSRSGNHAIINWIISQAHGRVCFLNCAEPKTNPFETARPLFHGSSYVVTYPDFDLEAERAGRFGVKDYLLHSYEDCFLGMLANGSFEDGHDRYIGPSRERLDVLILRDPYNLFASRRKAGYGGVTDRTVQRIWKQHAREFLDRRRYLRQHKVCISYNRWVRDRNYRREIAGRLGLEFTDAGFRSMSYFDQGSSFDCRDAYAERADRMRVLERWRHFSGDPGYREMFTSEIVRLSRNIFGGCPNIEQAMQEAS